MGNHTTVTIAGMSGAFELNVYLPVLADALLESVRLLANGVRTFTERCVAGIEANRDRIEASVERNLSIVTALAPEIGYDRAAAIAKEAFRSGRSAREVAKEQQVLPDDRIDTLLDPMTQTRPEEDP
jgi:fumarate hydratase class II